MNPEHSHFEPVTLKSAFAANPEHLRSRAAFNRTTRLMNDVVETVQSWSYMMTSSNGNILRVTGPLWGEFNGHRWMPRTKASDAELWYLLWPADEQTVEQTIETPVIWDATALTVTSV